MLDDRGPWADDISVSLHRVADVLEGNARSRTYWRESNLSRRYRPFVREVADHRGFCERLSQIRGNLMSSPDEARDRLEGILGEYSLPNNRCPWDTILTAAVLGFSEPVRAIAAPTVPEQIEVELALEFEGRPSGGLPSASAGPATPAVVQETAAALMPDASAEEAQQVLGAALTPVLEPLLARIRGANDQALIPRVTVRAIRTVEIVNGREITPLDLDVLFAAPERRETTFTEFTFSARTLSLSDLKEVVALRLIRALNPVFLFFDRRGRRVDPSPDLVRRWRRYSLDGATIRVIADEERPDFCEQDEVDEEEEVDEKEDVELDSTIAKEMQSLGVTRRKNRN